MSSYKPIQSSTPIRIDGDVHRWLMILKDATKSPSLSDLLRQILMEHYPNIETIVREAEQKSAEREAILAELVKKRTEA